MGLMKRAAAKAEQSKAGKGFKRPTIPVSEQMRDTVDRIVAAGMKLMYSPDMADERQAALSTDGPVAKVLAENVTGLLLVLDQKAQGGIPQEALFPAAMELLSDAAEMFGKAGKTVTQQDFNDAALLMYTLIGRKLGVSDEDLMRGVQQQVGDDESAESEPAGAAPPDVAPPAGMPPPGAPQPGMPPQGAAPQPEQMP